MRPTVIPLHRDLKTRWRGDSQMLAGPPRRMLWNQEASYFQRPPAGLAGRPGIAVIGELTPINIDGNTVVPVVNRDLGPLCAASGWNLEMADARRRRRWSCLARAG